MLAAVNRARRAALDESVQIWTNLDMKRVKIAELKSQLSKYLRAVEMGAEIEVTDRDRPIARIIPARAGEPPVQIIAARIPLDRIRKRRVKPARWSIDPVELLLEDRRKR